MIYYRLNRNLCYIDTEIKKCLMSNNYLQQVSITSVNRGGQRWSFPIWFVKAWWWLCVFIQELYGQSKGDIIIVPTISSSTIVCANAPWAGIYKKRDRLQINLSFCKFVFFRYWNSIDKSYEVNYHYHIRVLLQTSQRHMFREQPGHRIVRRTMPCQTILRVGRVGGERHTQLV